MAAPEETEKEEDSLLGAPTLCSAKIGLMHLEREAIEDAMAGEIATRTTTKAKLQLPTRRTIATRVTMLL